MPHSVQPKGLIFLKCFLFSWTKSQTYPSSEIWVVSRCLSSKNSESDMQRKHFLYFYISFRKLLCTSQPTVLIFLAPMNSQLALPCPDQISVPRFLISFGNLWQWQGIPEGLARTSMRQMKAFRIFQTLLVLTARKYIERISSLKDRYNCDSTLSRYLPACPSLLSSLWWSGYRMKACLYNSCQIRHQLCLSQWTLDKSLTPIPLQPCSSLK